VLEAAPSASAPVVATASKLSFELTAYAVRNTQHADTPFHRGLPSACRAGCLNEDQLAADTAGVPRGEASDDKSCSVLFVGPTLCVVTTRSACVMPSPSAAAHKVGTHARRCHRGTNRDGRAPYVGG
jgi:hypothetical protein